MFIKLQKTAFLQQNPFYKILKTQALKRQRLKQYNATDPTATEKKDGLTDHPASNLANVGS